MDKETAPKTEITSEELQAEIALEIRKLLEQERENIINRVKARLNVDEKQS